MNKSPQDRAAEVAGLNGIPSHIAEELLAMLGEAPNVEDGDVFVRDASGPFMRIHWQPSPREDETMLAPDLVAH